MEIASFTVEFFEHVPLGALQPTVALLHNKGASVEVQTERVWRIACTEPKQVSFVGRLLYSPGLTRVCHVTSTTGIAVARASAYIPTKGKSQ